VRPARAPRAWRGGAALAFALALALACIAVPSAAPAADAASAPGVQTVVDAEFCSSQSDAIPGADCGWKPVRLANLWTARDRGAEVENAWYRLHFHLDAVPSSGVALYMVALNRSARFHVNGRWLAQRGGFDPPLPLNWNRAQYVVVPPALLQPGDNVLQVQERIYTWEHGWLSPVAVGPEAVLLPQYERRRFWQNDLVRMLGATTLVLSVFVLGVWAGRRDQTMYFWFGCATLTWSAISLDYFALTSPLPGLAWEGFIEIAQVLRSVLIYVFVLRYCGRRAPVLERAMWAWWVVGAVCVATGALPVRWVEQWYLGTLLASLWFFALLVREAQGEDGRVAVVLRESIEDLQLIIDSLEPVENDLLTVLGTLRYRLQDRLGKSGIDLQWNVVDLPPLPILTPHSVLSILRIVQEAFANCLKHSGATRITVTTGLVGEPGNDEKAQIAIVDNGRGIDGTRVGRGLENMRRRAGALGGTLRISSRPGATEVLLVFPTLRAQEPGQVFP